MRQMCSLALTIDPRDGQQILLLTNAEEKRTIPISVTLSDAHNINLALSSLSTFRPLTHELMVNLVSQLGQTFACVEIDLGGDGAFFATIKIKQAGSRSQDKIISLIANPADAIVVAIRARVPIFVSEQVMAMSVSLNKSTDDNERKQFKQFVEKLKASDFKIEGLSNHS